MPRSIWKGAISFGLVHIPVGLVSATSSQGVDFDWLDKRSMDPVGYKRINKVTGKEITSENIVKGVQFEKGRYVVLSEEEIRTAHPQSTQTIDIFTFVEREQIPLQNIDTPYYLSPEKRGEKVYALLREALRGSGRVALARVVLHTRQYLAALMPLEDALVLVKLRWPAEVRSLAILELGSAVSKPDLAKAELDMAKRLIEDMSGDWQPDDYRDTFQEKIMELVEEKASAGKITHVEGVEAGEARRSADVIDLTELLKRSLSGKRGESAKSDTDDTASTQKEKPAPRKKTSKTARSK